MRRFPSAEVHRHVYDLDPFQGAAPSVENSARHLPNRWTKFYLRLVDAASLPVANANLIRTYAMRGPPRTGNRYKVKHVLVGSRSPIIPRMPNRPGQEVKPR